MKWDSVYKGKPNEPIIYYPRAPIESQNGVHPTKSKIGISGNTDERSNVVPRAGDLVLARVAGIGHHSGLELAHGRRAALFVGDEISYATAIGTLGSV